MIIMKRLSEVLFLLQKTEDLPSEHQPFSIYPQGQANLQVRNSSCGNAAAAAAVATAAAAAAHCAAIKVVLQVANTCCCNCC